MRRQAPYVSAATSASGENVTSRREHTRDSDPSGCYLCGGTDFAVLGGVLGHYDISVCRECGLGRTQSPGPGAARTEETATAGGPCRRDLTTLNRRRDKLARGTATDMKHLVGSGRVLDVGCSGGRLVREITKRGMESCGIDVEIGPLAAARETGVEGLAAGDAHVLPFAEGSFDLVHLSHTLEHLDDPRRVLGEAHRVLKPDGLVLISVPNHTGMLPRMTRNWVGYAPWMHVWHFSPASLIALLSESRFRTLRLKLGSMETPEIESRWKKLAWICLAALQKRIGMGDSMTMLARKEE